MCLSHNFSVRDGNFDHTNGTPYVNMVYFLSFTQVLVVEYDNMLKMYLHVNSDL